MKSKIEYLTFNTKTKRAFVNITPDVRKIVQDSKIKEGLCLVNAMHITASNNRIQKILLNTYSIL